MGAAEMWTRSVLRRHRAATVLLAVLIAAASGVVVAALASARQGRGSLDRFRDASRSWDATVFSCPPGVDPDSFDDQAALNAVCASEAQAEEVAAELARLPGVERASYGAYFIIGVLDPDATNGWGGISLLSADLGGDRLLVPGQPKLLEGRLPSATDPGEVMLNERAARRNDLHSGDTITISSWPSDEVDQAVTDGEPPTLPPVTLRIVGVGRFAGDLTPGESFDISGHYFSGELTTGGATGAELAAFTNYGVAAVVRLTDGPAGMDALQRQLSERWSDRVFFIDDNGEAAKALATARRRVDSEQRAVVVFAAIAAVATFGFAGLSLVRQLRREQSDVRVLRDLGMARRDLMAGAGVRAAVIALPAALGTVGVAIALSPLGPVGLAGRAELDRGIHVDALVLPVGALAVLGVIVGIGLLSPLLSLRPERPPAAWTGGVARLVSTIGTVPRTGLAFARSSWPRLATGVTAVCLAALVTAGIADRSMSRVAAEPEHYGAWWDLDLGDYSSKGSFDAGAGQLARNRDLAVVAGFDEQQRVAILNGGQPISLVAFQPVKGHAGPVVVRGRAPTAGDEIALARKTLADLGLDVGDRVHATVSGEAGGGETVALDLTVTGEVIIDNPVLTTAPLDEGGVVVPTTLDKFTPGLPSVPQRLLVRIAPEADREEVIARLSRDYPGAIRATAPPDDVRNFDRLRSLPWLLAALVAVLAAVTVSHALLVSVHRHRKDLAVLEVMGFDRRGIRSITTWTALAVLVPAAAIGVPAGLVAGRLLWGSVSSAIGVTAGPVRAWLPPLLAVAGAAIAIQLVTLAATVRELRPAPAELLRAE